MQKKHLLVLAALLVIYALAAFASYAFFFDSMAGAAGTPVPKLPASPTALGLINAAIILVVYGLFGLAGIWFARRLGLPGVFSEGGDWPRWVFIPLAIGVAGGALLVVLDRFFSGIIGLGNLPHPAFPFSILASLGAGIGEEIMFRGFVFGLWALVFKWLFNRWIGIRGALWAANVLAALAFSAAHIPSLMILYGLSSLSALPPGLLAEVFLLNSIIGLTAGERYMRDGLIAAVGVHFWADLVWHVIFPLIAASK